MRKYDSYKDSGVEWIGEIPIVWMVSKVKHVTRLVIDGTHFTPTYIDEGIPFLRVTDIHNDVINLDNVKYISFHEHKELTKRCLPEKGDLLLSKNGTIGITKVIDWDWEFSVFVSLCLIKFKKTFLPKLFSYFFQSSIVDLQIKESSKQSTVTNLHLDKIKELLLICPPLTEQHQIVSYLDRKTAQIDSLIEKTRRKIELLKENRTSLINEAVTKGLNPHVEMKDSGVEWIGEIPSHWDVKRLKNVSDVKPSNVDKHIFPDEIQVRLCNYTDVYYNDFISCSTELKKGSCNTLEFEKFKLEKGDVIITKDSESANDIGIPCLVIDDFDDVVCGYHLTLIRPLSLKGGYVFRFIQSDRTRRYFEVHSNGITRYGLGKSSIENLFIPYPPLSEQLQIVSYLDEHTQLIDKTVSVEERRIELLKAYRQSLISEVVTGKRKVTTDEQEIQ